jgi:hypothetical protein
VAGPAGIDLSWLTKFVRDQIQQNQLNPQAQARVATHTVEDLVVNGSVDLSSLSTFQLQQLKTQLGIKSNPTITTSLMSGGPPASPADGDIWLATQNLAASGTQFVTWQFQWDATFSVWRNIGGPPSSIWSTQSGPTFAADSDLACGWQHLDDAARGVLPRVRECVGPAVGGGAVDLLRPRPGGVIQFQAAQTGNGGAVSGMEGGVGMSDLPISCSAGDALSVMFWGNVSGTPQVLQATFSVLPMFVT